jgi:hypothetical protein
MALGDITIYSSDNGIGYPGDIDYVVATSTVVPQILSGEPVTRTAGAGNFAVALASGTATSYYPVIAGGPISLQPILGVAATTSNESTSGAQNGKVSVTPIDEPVTYLISTLATSLFFGAYATGTAGNSAQQVYDSTVGYRTTFNRVGGVGSSQLGGTYYINASDASAGGLIVEELDIAKFPGKVRFSFRNGLSYKA